MKKASLFTALILLLAGCSGAGGNHSNTFKWGDLSISEFENQENYFIVAPFEWMGKEPAVIESVELVAQGEAPIDTEDGRVQYTFYGADPSKGIGVYAREDLGDLDEIRGFEVEGESRLVLEISLEHVQPDPNRRMKIKYTVDGKEHEQILESPMIEQLRTEE